MFCKYKQVTQYDVTIAVAAIPTVAVATIILSMSQDSKIYFKNKFNLKHYRNTFMRIKYKNIYLIWTYYCKYGRIL